MSSSTSNASKFIHDSAFRPAVFWGAYLLGTATLISIVCALGITPAWSSIPGEYSVTVSFRDLDLARPEDANLLYRRIQGAAKRVCGNPGADLIEQSIWRACYRSAISDAVTKVNNPLLTAAHSGRPAPMTAMLSK
jgi:UrcA family protein